MRRTTPDPNANARAVESVSFKKTWSPAMPSLPTASTSTDRPWTVLTTDTIAVSGKETSPIDPSAPKSATGGAIRTVLKCGLIPSSTATSSAARSWLRTGTSSKYSVIAGDAAPPALVDGMPTFWLAAHARSIGTVGNGVSGYSCHQNQTDDSLVLPLGCSTAGPRSFELRPVDDDEPGRRDSMRLANHQEFLAVRKHIPVPTNPPSSNERIREQRVTGQYAQWRAAEFGRHDGRRRPEKQRRSRARP